MRKAPSREGTLISLWLCLVGYYDVTLTSHAWRSPGVQMTRGYDILGFLSSFHKLFLMSVKKR